MSDPKTNADRILDLADVVCEENASDNDYAELDSLLLDDPNAHDLYLDYCRIHVALNLLLRANRATRKVQENIPIGVAFPKVDASDFGSIPTSIAPSPNMLDSQPGGLVGYFSSGWPLAYLIATLICGVGLAIGYIVRVSQPAQIANHATSPSGSLVQPRENYVARITGTANCRWERKGEVASDQLLVASEGLGARDSGLGTRKSEIPKSLNPQIPKSLVLLGDQFVLSAGLMEITYNTGAKVILQGPCTYEVDSADGGYLAIGKLTARVETSTEYGVRSTEQVASGEWLVASDKMQNEKCKLQNAKLANAKSPILQISKSPGSQLTTNHYPLSTNSSPLFAVRTPTATITDLGTEFGVAVDASGGTTSQVFRGSVRVETIVTDGKSPSDVRILHENESVRVERRDGANPTVAVDTSTPSLPQTFIRELPKPEIKTLDLADVVAGGDGFSGRRNRGIDPLSGRFADACSVEYYTGDGKYHPVADSPLIDGVFMPGPDKPFQIDSAGHAFDGFTVSENLTLGYVWSGEGEGSCSVLGEVDYHSPDHRMIALHANKGITFDLEAIRRANPGWKPFQFRSVVGIGNASRENLLENGDFTSGVGGWVCDGEQGGVVEDDASPDRRNMLLNGPRKVYCDVPTVSIEEKQPYYLSFMAASPDRTAADGPAGSLTVRLCYKDKNGVKQIGEPLTVSAAKLNEGWATYTARWTTPPLYEGSACPRFVFETTGGRVAIDNVVFTRDLPSEYANVWVFVDGRVRFQRREINRQTGAMPVAIDIRKGDRFLTLAATAVEGTHVVSNHVMFGDPRIEMAQQATSGQ